jgi:hypothetical protein
MTDAPRVKPSAQSRVSRDGRLALERTPNIDRGIFFETALVAIGP